MPFGPKIAVKYNAEGRVESTSVVKDKVAVLDKASPPPATTLGSSRSLTTALKLLEQGVTSWAIIEKEICKIYAQETNRGERYVKKAIRSAHGYLIKQGYKLTL